MCLPRFCFTMTCLVAPRLGLRQVNSRAKGAQTVGAAGDSFSCLLSVRYDGSFAKGSYYNRNDPRQVERNGTVEGVLEAALEEVLQSPSQVCLTSRTDKGVSADINYCAAILAMPDTDEIFARSQQTQAEVNRWLEFHGHHLEIRSLQPLAPRLRLPWADRGFVCESLVRFKRYEYFILPSEVDSTGMGNSKGLTAWHLAGELNIDAMKEAADAFVGWRNFWAFTKKHGLQRNTTRHVTNLTIHTVQGAPSTNSSTTELLCISISAESFLYRMVPQLYPNLCSCSGLL